MKRNEIWSRALEAPIKHECPSNEEAEKGAAMLRLALTGPAKDVIMLRVEGNFIIAESKLPLMTPEEAYEFLWGKKYDA